MSEQLNRNRQGLAQELAMKSSLLGEVQGRLRALEVETERRVLDKEALERQVQSLSYDHIHSSHILFFSSYHGVFFFSTSFCVFLFP